MGFYRQVVIETYKGRNTGANNGIRARPIAGQGLNTSMNVECSSKMRKDYPVGTKFLLTAKTTNKEGGPDFLYAHYNAAYRVFENHEIDNYIRDLKI